MQIVYTVQRISPNKCSFHRYCTDLKLELVDVYSMSRVSSGSIVSDYGLDDRAIGVRFPAGVKDFSYSLFVQTGSGAHLASCTMGTGGLSPGAKTRPGCDASPPSAFMACSGTALALDVYCT
jgi:hypothetical protein